SDAAILDELAGGNYPERARLLAQRTAEMHLALAANTDDADFAPEFFTPHSQRSLYQSMRTMTKKMTELLKKKIEAVPENCRAEAAELIKREGEILRRQARLYEGKLLATRTRVHGDYHLGQVLNTGKDFIIIDFEGEPARALSERKMKRSALRDVAGMMRSFQYAAYSALWQPAMRKEDVPFLETWANLWYRQTSSVFLQSYSKTTAGTIFIPQNSDDLQIMLEAYLLDKAVYEIGYELNNRPTWVVIPIRGIKHILRAV